MTLYLNPTKISKEDFLQKYGTLVKPEEIAQKNLDDHSETCVVCLVDNGHFLAAGILDEQRDLSDFTDPRDFRPKKFYLVSTLHINAEGGVGVEVK